MYIHREREREREREIHIYIYIYIYIHIHIHIGLNAGQGHARRARAPAGDNKRNRISDKVISMTTISKALIRKLEADNVESLIHHIISRSFVSGNLKVRSG